jgi:hypothetical protein
VEEKISACGVLNENAVLSSIVGSNAATNEIPTIRPTIIPAEFPGEGSQLVYMATFTQERNATNATKGNNIGHAIHNVKTVTPLMISPSSSLLWSKHFARQLKTSVNNCMYVYIQQFDKFPTK